MSRTFSKILVICAMVVVLPLLVVGTVFAAYHSIDSTVKVGVVFVNDEKAENSSEVGVYATVKYGDENAEKLEIVKGHTQTATVSAVYSQKAYDFEGWFMGNADAYKQAVASGNVGDLDKSSELTFNMADTADIVAVYKVHTFTVSYSSETTAGAATQVKYGDKLADPQAKTDNTIPENQCYRGWLVNGDNTKRYKYATFDGEGPYNLANPLDSRKSVSLTLKQGETTKTYTAYTEDQDANATQVNLNDIDVDNVFDTVKKPGYKYAWKDSEGNVVNEIPAENAEFTLSEEAIQYKANITKGANITDEVANVTFTAESYEAISNLFNLKSKYSFFKVKQIMVDETPYEDAQTFVNAFVAANPDESATAEITVDSESKYKTLNISTGEDTTGHPENCGVVFQAGEGGNMFSKDVYNSTGAQKAVNLNSIAIEGDKLIFSLFELLNVNGEVVDLYSDKNQSEQVYFNGEARIFVPIPEEVTQDNFVIDISKDMTVYDFIEAVIAGWNDIHTSEEFPSEEEVFNLYQVELHFTSQNI